MGPHVSWSSIAFVAALCFMLRVAVPLALAGRGLPRAIEERLDAAIAPILAALVAVQLFIVHEHPAIDARAAGACAAAAVYLARRSFVLALAAAALLTSLLRLA
jgi:branched-subunit amino acid transport protein